MTDRLRNGLEPINAPKLGVSIERLISLRQWQTISAIEGRSIDAVRAQYDSGYKRDAMVKPATTYTLDWADEIVRRARALRVGLTTVSIAAGLGSSTLRNLVNNKELRKPSAGLIALVNEALDRLEKAQVAA